ncbi:DNA/RNA non-specific endonuclease [Pseudonocardia xinjiangensis]|uniref:DNA/RNA non-specific endonuclease n=1 Tax=Pseudonocardia xinjiangensis TaxID=75289 RepID=UPI003D93A1D6
MISARLDAVMPEGKQPRPWTSGGRSDPVWGEPAAAVQADLDTFVYPNAAPQGAEFNQSKQRWLGFEDYVLTYADTYDSRMSVFTARPRRR